MDCSTNSKKLESPIHQRRFSPMKTAALACWERCRQPRELRKHLHFLVEPDQVPCRITEGGDVKLGAGMAEVSRLNYFP